MQFETFRQSIKDGAAPADLSIYLQAMWYDAHGDWDKAHHMVDRLDDATACLVHAYLHRKEGDIWNADYWYNKAKQTRPNISLEKEWEQLVLQFLD